MRLLYLSADPGVPVFGGKGASVHLRAMARSLAGLRHEVIVASPRVEPGENVLSEHIRCVQITPVNPHDHASARDVLASGALQGEEVLELAARERVEAIYERYSLASFAGARATQSLGIPLAVEVNAPLREEARRFRTLVHEEAAARAEAETFAAARKIFAVSPSLASWLSGQPGLDGQIEVLSNAPPDRTFANKPPIDEGLPLMVGFAGGLKRWHGIDTLLEAIRLALQDGARIRLEILGTGPMEELVAAAASAEPRIRQLGQRAHDRALDALERWDIGLAPFDALEGFYFSPLKVLEYMAAGLCTVASDIEELGGMVRDAGVLVPSGDAQALAQVLVELDQDRARIRSLGVRAQQLVRSRPTWSDNAGRVVAALEQPLGAGAGR